MNATPGPILPKICDWMLNKNYKSHTRSQTIGNCFQFPSFRHRVKAITRERRTLPDLNLSRIVKTTENFLFANLDLDLDLIPSVVSVQCYD